MTATQHQIGCYWWSTSKPSQFNTECGKHTNKIVEWPRSGTNCQFCGQIMAYVDNEADAKLLHKTQADVAWRHKA
jgi:hypothetical protein